MQTSALTLRNAARSPRSEKLPLAAVAHVRHMSFRSNPLDWIRTRLMPSPLKPQPEAKVAAAKRRAVETGANIFETITPVARKKATAEARKADPFAAPVIPSPRPTSHKFSTSNFKISHRKLNDIGRQISGKPINYAILQMQFSEKRASTRIKSMLELAKSHAVAYKKLDESRLVVAEAWVNKGSKNVRRLEPRARGHTGVQTHPDSRLHVVLKEGKTLAETKKADKERKLRKIVSAMYAREDRPIRNPQPKWAW